ncbi:MAG: YebC/PmpR family DNA-binding transcriptional regulator [Bacteroidota bacterium]
MSGHSKWATIKRKKAAVDAKRGKIFTRLIKEITIAARHGGGDPEGNPRLRLAVDNAKAANMPADNIERAIKKATGELEGAQYHEVMYEGYGPGGTAIIVEAATDNKNRTTAEVRHIFGKYHGTMGESNSVAWMFERKGIVTVKRNGKPEDEMMELVIDAGADDLITDEEYFEVKTSIESFEPSRKFLAGKKLEIENASLQWVAKNHLSVNDEHSEQLMKLIEAIEECDDVQNVFTNADFVD